MKNNTYFNSLVSSKKITFQLRSPNSRNGNNNIQKLVIIIPKNPQRVAVNFNRPPDCGNSNLATRQNITRKPDISEVSTSKSAHAFLQPKTVYYNIHHCQNVKHKFIFAHDQAGVSTISPLAPRFSATRLLIHHSSPFSFVASCCSKRGYLPKTSFQVILARHKSLTTFGNSSI